MAGAVALPEDAVPNVDVVVGGAACAGAGVVTVGAEAEDCGAAAGPAGCAAGAWGALAVSGEDTGGAVAGAATVGGGGAGVGAGAAGAETGVGGAAGAGGWAGVAPRSLPMRSSTALRSDCVWARCRISRKVGPSLSVCACADDNIASRNAAVVAILPTFMTSIPGSSCEICSSLVALRGGRKKQLVPRAVNRRIRK